MAANWTLNGGASLRRALTSNGLKSGLDGVSPHLMKRAIPWDLPTTQLTISLNLTNLSLNANRRVLDGVPEKANACCAGDAAADGRHQQFHRQPRRGEQSGPAHRGVFRAARIHGRFCAVGESGLRRPSRADAARARNRKH